MRTVRGQYWTSSSRSPKVTKMDPHLEDGTFQHFSADTLPSPGFYNFHLRLKWDADIDRDPITHSEWFINGQQQTRNSEFE